MLDFKKILFCLQTLPICVSKHGGNVSKVVALEVILQPLKWARIVRLVRTTLSPRCVSDTLLSACPEKAACLWSRCGECVASAASVCACECVRVRACACGLEWHRAGDPNNRSLYSIPAITDNELCFSVV